MKSNDNTCKIIRKMLDTYFSINVIFIIIVIIIIERKRERVRAGKAENKIIIA